MVLLDAVGRQFCKSPPPQQQRLMLLNDPLLYVTVTPKKRFKNQGGLGAAAGDVVAGDGVAPQSMSHGRGPAARASGGTG